MTDGMMSWLRAQIEADLMRALGLPRGPWHAELLGDKGYPQRVSNGRAVLIAETFSNAPQGSTPADHIAAHDSQTTIARCEAELAELALHEPNFADCCPLDDQVSPCESVRIKASGYRHRPGFGSWEASE